MLNHLSLTFYGILVAAVVAGCGRAPVEGLDASDRLTLYSLDGEGKPIEVLRVPLDENPEETRKKPAEEFHQFPVLGKVEIADAAKRAEIMRAFKQGIERSDGSMAKCFWPRHGIRVTKDKIQSDYVDLLRMPAVRNARGFNHLDKTDQPRSAATLQQIP